MLEFIRHINSFTDTNVCWMGLGFLSYHLFHFILRNYFAEVYHINSIGHHKVQGVS
eukprot:UN02019